MKQVPRTIWKILILLSLSIIAGTLPSFAGEPEEVVELCTGKLWPEQVKKHGDFPFVSYSGDTMCLAKGIWPEGVNEAVEIVRQGKIKKILISSVGGDADAAMILAEEILKWDIDIYVDGPCFSSCANYIFMAGKRKFILKYGVVAWHGAPRLKENSHPNAKRIVERHHAFFKRIGVDEEITWKFPCDLKTDPEFVESVNSNKGHDRALWTYTKEAMDQKFNIQGIVALWDPRNSAELRAPSSYEDMYRKVFLAHGCDD